MIAASIDVTIDEVVLRGVPPEQARVVLAHLEERLRALALGSLDPSGAPRPVRLDRAESSRRLPDLEDPAPSAAALGRSVAEAVWSELAGHRRTNGPAT